MPGTKDKGSNRKKNIREMRNDSGLTGRMGQSSYPTRNSRAKKDYGSNHYDEYEEDYDAHSVHHDAKDYSDKYDSAYGSGSNTSYHRSTHSNIQKRRKPVPKAKTKKAVRKIRIEFVMLVFIAFVLGLLYIPSIFIFFTTEHINTAILTEDTIEDVLNVNGLLVRDEAVLKSPVNGSCILTVEQGEKVPSDFVIATILKDEAVTMQKELEQLEINIIKRQMDENKNKAFYSADIDKVEEQIKDNVMKMNRATETNNMSIVNELKKDMDYLILKRADIISGFSNKEVYLSSQKDEKQKLQELITKNRSSLVSPKAGMVSRFVDGYEEQLAVENIHNITPELIDSVKPDAYKTQFTTGFDVEEGQAVAKVVKSLENYFVFYVVPEKVQFFHTGKEMEVRFNALDKRVKATVVNISPEIQGKRMITISFDTGIMETLQLRKTNVDIIIHNYSGLKVPVKSLRNINHEKMTAEIVLVKYNYSSVRRVNIVGMNQFTAIITSVENYYKGPVALFDVYVCDPENIMERQLIRR